MRMRIKMKMKMLVLMEMTSWRRLSNCRYEILEPSGRWAAWRNPTQMMREEVDRYWSNLRGRAYCFRWVRERRVCRPGERVRHHLRTDFLNI